MPSGHWQHTLASGGVVLLDGGTGSELKRRGASFGRAAWSGPAAQEHPALLQAIHEDYIRAGAQVVVTNTFATARSTLEAAELGTAAHAITRQAVEIARKARAACGQAVAVAGSISNLPPNMNPQHYPPEAVERRDLLDQARVLADSGVDLIATEMLQHPDHGAWALEAALSTGLPVWLGVSCRLSGGELVAFNDPDQPFADVLQALVPLQPAVVNIMHTELAAIGPAIALVRAWWDGPLGVYPEVPYSVKPSWRSEITPQALAQLARRWIAEGAQLIGGCCGTGPEHIAAMATMLRAH